MKRCGGEAYGNVVPNVKRNSGRLSFVEWIWDVETKKRRPLLIVMALQATAYCVSVLLQLETNIGDRCRVVFRPVPRVRKHAMQFVHKRSLRSRWDRRSRCAVLPQVRSFPALRRLFERLREDGIKIEVYKKITGIGPFLADDTSSDDVSNSKPDPDIFRASQKKLGIDPRNIISIRRYAI